MRALVLLVALTACTPSTPVQTFRDPAVTIASKADFDAARFAGRWHEIARLEGAVACPLLDAGMAGHRLRLAETCVDGRRRRVARLVGPGRLALSDGTELWVLWIDADGRTAILASPDGGIARILDRQPYVAEDRWRAALAVLEFNGFRTDALAVTSAAAGRIGDYPK
ncbi:lipocalin family protein [uncultured Jannaschia sp.]|uniref:lipocalin family protein n=1 Tax=uncultured Jannaschia sp. TaxID=293347 RepID=UPI002610B74F|nr:lipocalin family protein [uncultured Jannaschia sp.]